MGNLAFIKSFDEKNYYAFQIEGKGGILFLGKKKDFHYETSYKILRSLKLASKLLLFEVFDQSYCDAATIYTQIFFERFIWKRSKPNHKLFFPL